METTPLIEMRDVSHNIPLNSGQLIKVLSDINLSVMPNEILSILGPSGSGKSTTLRLMSGLLFPTHGKILSRGKNITHANHDVSMVFQNFALLPWMTTFENIRLGLDPLGLDPEVATEKTMKVIEVVGLGGFEEAYPRELSGGMKQRVGVARALVMERPVLFLDEPFSALDVLTAESMRREVLNLWLNKQTTLQSLVLVTHNINEAASLGGRIIVMGTHPGHIRLNIKNDLPYPRDEKSAAFKSLVDNIHDIITEAIIPDTPEWVPPALAGSVVESVPPVHIGEILGLLEMVMANGGRVDAFALAHKLMKDSVQILLMAKGAELLDLVDTPKNSIVLTDLGRKLVMSDNAGKKLIVHDAFKQLKLAQILHEKLTASSDNSLSSEDAATIIHELLPNENSETILETLIQWGRYSDLFSYNDNTKTIYLDANERE